MTEPSDLAFECPVCHEPVNLGWKACPKCGVEFDSDDAPAEGPGPLENLEKEITVAMAAPATAASPAPTDELVALEKRIAEVQGALEELEEEIEVVVAPALAPPSAAPPPKTPAQPPAPAPAATLPPPAAVPAAPAAEKARSDLAPVLSVASIGLLIIGAFGVMLALNWDTWVSGQSVSTIGSLQQAGILGMDALTILGLVLYLLAAARRQGATA